MGRDAGEDIDVETTAAQRFRSTFVIETEISPLIFLGFMGEMLS
jgi:hypothetical protein